MVAGSPAAKARRRVDPDVVVATDVSQPDLDRAAAVSRIARRKSTVPARLAAIRRQCIARVRADGVVLDEIAQHIGVTVPRVIQLLADHRNREGVGHVPPG